MDEKYRDCVALRFIAAGFRILEGRNIQTFLDCGIRIIINVNIEMVWFLQTFIISKKNDK